MYVSCEVGYFPTSKEWRIRVCKKVRNNLGRRVVYKFNVNDFEVLGYFWASWGRKLAKTGRGCNLVAEVDVPKYIFTSLYNAMEDAYDDVFEEIVGYSGRTGYRVLDGVDGGAGSVSLIEAFRFNEDMMKRIRSKRGRERYVALEKREMWHISDEAYKEALDRIEHNKNAALQHKRETWWIMACEEEAKLFKRKWSQAEIDKAVQEFKEAVGC